MRTSLTIAAWSYLFHTNGEPGIFIIFALGFCLFVAMCEDIKHFSKFYHE